jgi:hypothetical protein
MPDCVNTARPLPCSPFTIRQLQPSEGASRHNALRAQDLLLVAPMLYTPVSSVGPTSFKNKSVWSAQAFQYTLSSSLSRGLRRGPEMVRCGSLDLTLKRVKVKIGNNTLGWQCVTERSATADARHANTSPPIAAKRRAQKVFTE